MRGLFNTFRENENGTVKLEEVLVNSVPYSPLSTSMKTGDIGLIHIPFIY